MATFYVDSINGDNSNDGLTPATAFADFYTSQGGSTVEPIIFWVRNTSTFTLTENIALLYVDIIFWPSDSEAYGYDDRPTVDTTTWDNDDNSGMIDTSSFYFNNRAAGRVGMFRNITFLNTSTTANQPAILIGGGKTEFDNCDITHYKTGVQLGSFTHYGSGSNWGTTINFRKCTFDVPSASVVAGHGNNDSGDTNYDIYLNFNDCSGSVYSLSSYYSTLSNRYHRGKTIKIYDCNFVCLYVSGVSFRYTDKNYGINHHYVEIYDSTITTTHIVSSITTDVNHGVLDQSAKIIRSHISCSSHMLYYYQPAYNSEKYVNFGPFEIRDSNISASSMIYSYAVGNDGRHNFNKYPIVIVGNTLSISQALYLRGVYTFGGVIFKNNTILSCSGTLFIVDFSTYNNYHYLINYESTNMSYVDISNATIGGDLFRGSSNIQANIQNCNIGGVLTTSGCKECFISVDNSSFDSIQGGGEYSISHSSIIPTGVISAVTKASKAIFKDCIIESQGVPISSGVGDVIITNSEVTNDMSAAIAGRNSIYNSILNGIQVAYEARVGIVHKKLSPVFRLGGSPGTLSITAPLSDNTDILVDEIRGELTIGSEEATIYLAADREILINDTDRISAVLWYTSLGGAKTSVDMTFLEDTTSQWDGLVVNYSKYKMTVTIPSLLIDYTKKVYIDFSIRTPESIVKDFYFDLNIVSS